MTIAAEAIVPAPPQAVFGFLSNLENHWLLADRFIEVVTLERSAGEAVHGGTVRMHGPLGTRRTATTRVIDMTPISSMSGTAELSGGTRAHVSWTLTPAGGATRVHLAARVERASLPDRIVLATGGKAWLRRRFAAILATLARRFAPPD
jgi:uncharacterized protein YndB with AHSA1/START domain